jgi:hypothetical protein
MGCNTYSMYGSKPCRCCRGCLVACMGNDRSLGALQEPMPAAPSPGRVGLTGHMATVTTWDARPPEWTCCAAVQNATGVGRHARMRMCSDVSNSIYGSRRESVGSRAPGCQDGRTAGMHTPQHSEPYTCLHQSLQQRHACRNNTCAHYAAADGLSRQACLTAEHATCQQHPLHDCCAHAPEGTLQHMLEVLPMMNACCGSTCCL